MSLAWLLFIRSVRHYWRRFLLLATSLGVGILLLFLTIAGLNGLSGRMNSTSWRQTVIQSSALSHQELTTEAEPLYALLSGPNVSSSWRDKEINETRLAASGPSSPEFQGMPTPGGGEYYVSPGLKKVIEEHPEDAIGSRFGEKLLGVIPDRYVSSPDELSVVSGVELAAVKELESSGASVMKLYSISQEPSINPTYANIITPVIYLGAFLALLPVMLLISAAAQLSNSQQEQRYAALRLIGASRAQVRRTLIVESLVVSATGAIIGLALYSVVQPLTLEFRFNDMRFWSHEVAISFIQIGTIIISALVFTTFIKWRSMRYTQLSPLSVVRRNVHHKQLHWWRLIPLTLGLGAIGFLASPLYGMVQDTYNNAAVMLAFSSIAMLSFGIIIAGPFIVQRLAGLIARHAKRAETLLGMRYIANNPLGALRTVSGVTVALLIGGFLLVCANGMQSFMAQSVSDDVYSRLQPNTALLGTHVGAGNPLPGGQEATLQGLDYVDNVTEVKQVSYTYMLMSCQTADKYFETRCPDNKHYIGMSFNLQVSPDDLYGSTEEEIYRQIDASGPYADISAVTPNYLIKLNPSSIDKLRSFVSSHYANDASVGAYLFDGTSSNTPFVHPLIKESEELARIGIVATSVVAIISLAISITGKLMERRYSLINLRLVGMTTRSLKQVVVIESLVPLLSVTVMSSVTGMTAGFVLLGRLGLEPTMRNILSVPYLLLYGAYIIVSTIIIMSILPLIKKITDPDLVRVE